MMSEERFELILCSNGVYYLYENGAVTDIDFDKFNRESAEALIGKCNTLYEENIQLREQNEDLKKENNYLHFQNKLHSQGVRYKTPFSRQKLYELGGVDYIRKIKQRTKTIYKTSKTIGCSTTLIYSFLRENGTSWSEI